MRLLRVLLFVAGGLVVLAGIAALAVFGIVYSSDQALVKTVTLPAENFDKSGGDVIRGEHLVKAVTACGVCHAADFGGTAFIEDPSHFGILYAPNLTTGPWGVGQTFSGNDWEHAIRHGIGPDGTRLLIMPSASFSALSDSDLRDIIAFLLKTTPVQRAAPARSLGPVGRTLIATGQLKFDGDEIDQTATHPATMQPAPDANYGKYLAHIGGCMECHGANLAGGHYEGAPSDPPAANITPAAIGTWSLEQFKQTIKTGVDPSGHHLNPFMPWQTYGNMNDQEFAALYAFLKTVAPVSK